jgi:hypothetical protein
MFLSPVVLFARPAGLLYVKDLPARVDRSADIAHDRDRLRAPTFQQKNDRYTAVHNLRRTT